ncbi:MAG: 50S ribosome-binding GTPase [Planctomycetes bacterium]|nr:50S ribosome-binding GTPase [Planctomycetota bacterium]
MLDDTIHAVASPPGRAERGVIRVSGPAACAAVAALLAEPLPRARAAGVHTLRILGASLPVLVLVMPGPRSFTGEDVVELHLPGAPLLLAEVGAALAPAARPALPGEFTRRAYQHGRLSLLEAEGVLAAIQASTEAERRAAAAYQHGGLAEAVTALRMAIQDLRAVLESGLDFTAEETGAVDPGDWLPGLRAVRQRLAGLRAGLPAARPGGEVLLVGYANAGKSSLCNALGGGPAHLVSPVPGTTRDVLGVAVAEGVVLLDGPGEIEGAGGVEAEALALRDRLAGRAQGAILVVDGVRPRVPPTALPVLAVVVTKRDLLREPPEVPGLPAVPRFDVCAPRGDGLEPLRAFLAACGGGAPETVFTRVRDHLDGADAALARAEAAGSAGLGDEVAAAELALALEALDQVHGRSSPEGVLDRVFARFCLGK